MSFSVSSSSLQSSFSLQTDRLRLRELPHDDLDFVATMLTDPDVMRFHPKCFSREESAGWIDRQLARYARDGHGLWLVLERESGESPRAGVTRAAE